MIKNNQLKTKKQYNNFIFFVNQVYLILLQILDGILTYAGVMRFGPEAEGNPLIKYCIVNFGLFESLVVIKGLGIVLVIILCYIKINRLILYILGIVTVLYTGAVILWVYVLFFRSNI